MANSFAGGYVEIPLTGVASTDGGAVGAASIEGLQLDPAAVAPAAPVGGIGGLAWLLLAAFVAGVLFPRQAQDVRVRLPRLAGA